MNSGEVGMPVDGKEAARGKRGSEREKNEGQVECQEVESWGRGKGGLSHSGEQASASEMCPVAF